MNRDKFTAKEIALTVLGLIALYIIGTLIMVFLTYAGEAFREGTKVLHQRAESQRILEEK